MPRLRKSSIDQILCVLDMFWSRTKAGENPRYAYTEAVRATARKYLLAYQTIGDLCRRRLGLPRIEDFHRLLEDWVGGDPLPLKELLFQHAPGHTQSRIKDFFNSHSSSVDGHNGKSNIKAITTYQVPLLPSVAVNLRRLAESQDRSVEEYISDFMTTHVRESVVERLHAQLEELGSPEAKEVLAELEKRMIG